MLLEPSKVEAEDNLLQHTEDALIKPKSKKSQDDKNSSLGKVRKVKRLQDPHAAVLSTNPKQLDFDPENASKGYMTARNETRDKIEMTADTKDKDTEVTSSKLSKAFGLHK